MGGAARRRNAQNAFVVLLPLGAVLLSATAASASPGDLDPSFGSGGVTTTAFPHARGAEAATIAVDGAGRLVVAGYVQPAGGGPSEIGLARYATDGSIDPSFGTGGEVVTPVAQPRVAGVVIQPDGKIVVAGADQSGCCTLEMLAIRYLDDGRLDDTFGNGGFVRVALSRNSGATAAALQPNGRLVLGGFSLAGNRGVFTLVGLTSSGALDPTFGSGGVTQTDFGYPGAAISDIVVLPDGRIGAVGTVTFYANRREVFGVAVYTVDGELDPSFGGDGTSLTHFGTGDAEPTSLAFDPAGALVAIGHPGPHESPNRLFAVRMLLNGHRDPTFGGDGRVNILVRHLILPRAVVVQADHRVLVGGTIVPPLTDREDFGVVRLRADGSTDASFGGDGIVSEDLGSPRDQGFDIALTPGASPGAVVVGSTGKYDQRFALARFLT